MFIFEDWGQGRSWRIPFILDLGRRSGVIVGLDWALTYLPQGSIHVPVWPFGTLVILDPRHCGIRVSSRSCNPGERCGGGLWWAALAGLLLALLALTSDISHNVSLFRCMFHRFSESLRRAADAFQQTRPCAWHGPWLQFSREGLLWPGFRICSNFQFHLYESLAHH